MVAFAAAVDLGFRYLETDVRTTADGVLVAFHDDDLSPVTDRKGPISQVTYDQVRRARIGGADIPRLEEVLGAWPDVRVYVDAKDDPSVEKLVAALDRTGAHERVCVGSFLDHRVARLRSLTRGRVCTWMGRREVARLRLASWGLPSRGFAAGSAQVPVRKGRVPVVDPRFVDEARRRAVAVHVWIIDERPEMERLLDMGVDGIISNRPSLLKEVFVERGLWA